MMVHPGDHESPREGTLEEEPDVVRIVPDPDVIDSEMVLGDMDTELLTPNPVRNDAEAVVQGMYVILNTLIIIHSTRL